MTVGWLAGILSLSLAHADADRLQKHLLVVFNDNDPESRDLAQYYASQRNIPSERVLGLHCPLSEEISRSIFQKTIHDPIEQYLKEKNWLQRKAVSILQGESTLPVLGAEKNDIWVMVLIRGIPLKIAHDPTIHDDLPKNPALNTNAASVDSDLALLPSAGLPITGPENNPYFTSGFLREFDFMDARRMILVTRLDAPRSEDVRRMIDDSLWAETHRLVGRACLDARGFSDPADAYYMGDEWLHNMDNLLARQGWNVTFDNKPDLFPSNLPWSNVALYFGWYSENASGPFMHNKTTFSRGAIAYHLHSFSAETLRSPTLRWAGPLITQGAAATMGCVYEPYLDLTPHLDIFMDALVQGYTLAEAGFLAQRVLSWMDVIIGDPLYRPFAQPLSSAIELAQQEKSPTADFLKFQDLRVRLESAEVQSSADEIQQWVTRPEASFAAWEEYGDLRQRPTSNALPSQVEAYDKALTLVTAPADMARIGLKAAEAHSQLHQWTEAYQALRTVFNAWPQEALFYGLDDMARKIAAQPGAPPIPAGLTPARSTSR